MSHIFLYKYLPMNAGSLCVLTEGTIKFSDPFSFNDPFDCQPVVLPATLAGYSVKRPNIEAALGHRSLSPAKRLIANQRVNNRLGSYMLEGGLLKDMFGSMHVSICCLSSDPLDILMWSHYAEFHSGFVVEFKVPLTKQASFLEEARLYPLPVRYTDDRPVLDVCDLDLEPAKLLDTVILSKARQWEYEKEHRIIRRGGPSEFPKYQRSMLTSVIAGCKTDGTQMAQLIRATKTASQIIGGHVDLFQAEMDKRHYRINVPGFRTKPKAPPML